MAAGRFYVVMDPQEVTDVDEGASGRLSVRFQGGAKSATVAGELFPLNEFARVGPYAPAVSAGYILELATDVATGGDTGDSSVGYDLTWSNGDGEVHALFVGQPADSIVNLSTLAESETIPLSVSNANAVRAEEARDAAEAAQAAAEAVGATNDAIISSRLEDTASDTRGSLDAIMVAGRPVRAYDHGVRAGTGTSQVTNLAAAFAAAEAAGGGAHVELPPGVITISGGLSLSGYSSGIRGQGGSATAGLGPSTGTVLKCISQSGPVIDFTGFLFPNAQRGRAVFSDFAVEGDDSSGTTKKGIYVYSGGASSSSLWRNVTISKTGGAGLHVKDHYLSDFHAVTVCTPVSAASNNVPYVLLEGASGSRFYGLGIRSTIFDGTADMGTNGAVRMLMGAVYQQHRSLFSGLWFENMHVPTNGSMVVTQTNAVTFSDTQFFDCFKVAAATNTTHFRIESPASSNLGGNIIRGVIPGQGTDSADIDRGVIVQQSGNRIEGSKGYRGNHVQLDSGVEYTTAFLGGAVLAANTSAFVDNSGNTTNTLIDSAQGLWQIGGRNASNVRVTMLGVDVGDKLTTLASQTGSWAINLSGGANTFVVPLGGNTTMTGFTNGTAQVGRLVTLILKQDATGSRTITWNTGGTVKFANNTNPTLSTAANAVDTISFRFDGTNWRETGRAFGQS